MAQQRPSLDALVLRGSTIATAVRQLGLLEAWNAGEPFLLRGRLVQAHATIAVPLRGRIHATFIARNSIWVGLGLRLAPGSTMRNDSKAPDVRRREYAFPTDEQLAEMSRDPRILRRLRATGKTFERAVADQAMPVDVNAHWDPEASYSYEATEGLLKLVVVRGDVGERVDATVGLTLERHGDHDVTVGLAAPAAAIPRFDAAVYRLSVEPT